MKENIFFTDTHEIGQTQKPIKPIQKMGRGAKVDEISDIKDIAKAIREYVKKKYPNYKFSVNIDRFAGGQSLRVNWYQADFNPLVSEEAWGDTRDGKTFSINEYYFETNEKLTKKAIAVIKDVRDFYQQYNYDYSDSQSDYYNTRFYEDFKIGAWGKPFVQTSGKPEKPKPSKPTGEIEQGIEPPMFSDGQSVIYKTSKGDKEGTIEYSKYVKSQNKYIYGIRTSTNTLLTIWESNIRALETPQETPSQSETPSELPFKVGDVFRANEEGSIEATYTITKIDDVNTEFRVQDLKTGERIMSSFKTIYISNIISNRSWIPYDPLDENPQEQPEMPQPETKYKVGDVFRRNLEGEEPPNTKITYTILSIGEEKTQYRIDYLDKQSSRLSTKSNEKILEEITDDWWIKYELSETPLETKNEAIEELDDELILLNDLRKKTGILQDPDAQKEFREEISSLIDTREIFTETEKFNVENLISTYFDNAIMNFNLPITSEQFMVDENEIREITKSKDFKDWFGDWENTKYPSSKAMRLTIDPIQALPLVVYHGTKNPTHYSRFKTDKFPLIYFATNKKYAEWFAQLGNGIIYECFLNVRFPINFVDLELKDITWQELSEFVKEKYGLELPKFPNLTERRKVWAWIRFDAETNFSLINAIKEAQFDAIIHIENNPQQLDDKGNEEITKAYMIFDPKNVKLVKFAKQTKGFSEIMFLKEGGRLSLMEEIKNLKK